MSDPPHQKMTSSNFSATWINTKKDLELLAPEWNTLLHSSEADSVFLTWEWISSWLETICPDASLMVVAVRDAEQRLIAVAPFYRSRLYLFGWIPHICLRILGDRNSGAEYQDIIIQHGLEDQAIPLLARLYSEHAQQWDWVWLTNIAGWTGALERLTKTFQSSAFPIKIQPYSFSAIQLPPLWEEFSPRLSKPRLSKSHVSKLRYLNRRASNQHALKVQRCSQQKELPQFFNDFFTLHTKHWQSKGQSGSFARWSGMDDFYRSFAAKALRNGWLGFFSLHLDGAPQASQYGLVYNNIFSSIQEGFDPDGISGVGKLLREKVILWCMENHIREYDFLGVHSPHKASWASTERWGWRLFLGRRTLKNLLIRFAGIWPSGRFIKP